MQELGRELEDAIDIDPYSERRYGFHPGDCEDAAIMIDTFLASLSAINRKEEKESDQAIGPRTFWIMIVAGPSEWHWRKPDGPCWKGDIVMGFHYFHVSIGWQANPSGESR